MKKSYLIGFSTKDETCNCVVNSLVLVHAENYEEAVEKIKSQHEDKNLPLNEGTVFTNATIE
jgi:acyl-CoA reductase-like NAD-dependent aldehyde dehydrogenase